MTRREIEDLIYSYHWMRKEVDRLERIMYGSSVPMRSWGVAQYGVEATLPRGTSIRSQTELEEMDIREQRFYNRLKRYREKVYKVEWFADYIAHNSKDERMPIVIDCMMEGMSYRAIAAHLGTSHENVRRMKNRMITQLCHLCQM